METKRKTISLIDSIPDLLIKMSEGNIGATTVLTKMLIEPQNFLNILSLDDMNIRGSQIWIGYKDYCGEKLNLFMDCIKNRNPEMIETINIMNAKQGCKEKAISNSASSLKERPIITDNEMEKFSSMTPKIHPTAKAEAKKGMTF